MTRLVRKLLAVVLVPVGLLATAFAWFIWQMSGFKSETEDIFLLPMLACAAATVIVPVLVWPRGRTPDRETERSGELRE